MLETPQERVRRRVYNVGRSDENYRKLDLVEIITGEIDRGNVSFVHRDEDPRDYRVSFERIRSEPGLLDPHAIALERGEDDERPGDAVRGEVLSHPHHELVVQ